MRKLLIIIQINHLLRCNSSKIHPQVSTFNDSISLLFSINKLTTYFFSTKINYSKIASGRYWAIYEINPKKPACFCF